MFAGGVVWAGLKKFHDFLDLRVGGLCLPTRFYRSGLTSVNWTSYRPDDKNTVN